MAIRIDALDATVLPSRDYVVPAMRDGLTVKLTIGQILDLLVGAAPGALNTLEELAAALADDENFAATVTASLATKASLTGAETLTNKTLTTPTLVLKQSSSPTPTAEGDAQWDTDDNALVVGDGSGQKIFRPTSWETIGTVDISSSTPSVDIAIPPWAKRLRISGYFLPVSNGDSLWLRCAVGGTFNTTAGNYTTQYVRGDGTVMDSVRDTTTLTALILLPSCDNAASGGGIFVAHLTNVAIARRLWVTVDSSYSSASGNIQKVDSAQTFTPASIVSNIRFLASSGNIGILDAVIEASR